MSAGKLVSERMKKRLTQHRELERDVWESYIEPEDQKLLDDFESLERDRDALEEQSNVDKETIRVWEMTHKTTEMRAESVEAGVKE